MNNPPGTGNTNYLSSWQQISLITSTMIGVGVLTLPRSTTQVLREAGWMAPLLGSAIAILLLWLIVQLQRRYPRLTFIQYSELVWGTRKYPRLGKLLGFPWILLFLSYELLNTATTARVFGEVAVTAVLLETPLEVIIITMFGLALWLCCHEVDVVARVNELLFPLILFPVLFIALASFQKAQWNNVLPFFTAGWRDLLHAGLETSFSFQGFEIMLIFFAFAQPGTNLFRSGTYAIGFASFVYTLIVLAGIAVFGHDELQRVTWPTLELVKSTKVPGLILERLESAFLAVWVAAVFTTVGNTLYVVVYGLRQYFGKGMWFQRITAALLMVPLFFISLLPQNIIEIAKTTALVGYAGLLITFFIPLVYLLVSLLRGRSKLMEKEEAQ